MTHRRDFLLSAIAIALLAAIVALLASGAWERAAATPSEATERIVSVVFGGTSHSPARSLRGAPQGQAMTGYAPGVASGPAGAKHSSGVPPSGAVGTVLLGGTLSYVDPKYGPEYLALPFPRGTVAEICAVRCVTRRSTDYGPDQRVHPDRIADLSASDFEYVCGVPLSAGLCRGTVEIDPPVDPADERMRLEDRPLPATDVAPTPSEASKGA